MVKIHAQQYHYLEEINDGIIKNLSVLSSGDTRILDVGCGQGTLARAIKNKGYEVWGIDSNNIAAKIAGERLDKVICADLMNVDVIRRELGKNIFDAIIFSDILEHTYDPFFVLNLYLPFLKAGGKLFVSVPNSVVWTNRLAFLFGFFEYTDTGVMDRTHIRFFTFRTAKRLVNSAGCDILKVDYTPFIVRAFLPIIKMVFNSDSDAGNESGELNRRKIIDSPLYKIYMKYVYAIEYFIFSWWKSLFGFRIIVVGVKK